MVEASHAVVEHTLFNITDASPTVVVALTPPYYPVVDNAMLGDETTLVERVVDATIARGASEFGEHYERFHIIGMSDLSYFMKNPSPGDNAYVRKNMLLWGDIYEIPFDEIDDISMPVLNIGPWGKDIHKYTERVLREDLVSRTPDLMSFAIERLLGRA
jgi:arginine utilization protein RocB